MVNESAARHVGIPTALSSSGLVSVIGVVVDVFRGAFQSSRSWCITFTLKDTDFGNGHVWDGLKIKYFKDNQSQLPPVRVHDVILLRNITIRKFNGRPLGVAPDETTIPWAIFRPEPGFVDISPICGPVPFEPSYSEKSYALSLIDKSSKFKSFRNASNEKTAPPTLHSVKSVVSAPQSNANRRFSLIKDVEEKTYVDLTGEIVKIFTNDSDKVALYLTDYTTNEGLHNYTIDANKAREGDEYAYLQHSKKQWQGPAGRMTLQITLWDPHASFAREHLKEGSIVRLRNVHIKRSRIEGAPLEAAMHCDRQHPDEMNIRLIDAENDERGRELLRRRKGYWESDPRKRKAEEMEETSSRRSKSQRSQNKTARAKKEEGQTSLSLSKKYEINKTIQASNPSIRCTSLADILDGESHENISPNQIEYRIPFQNVCYRATVRVVDFFPPKLEDFAVPEESDHKPRPDAEVDEPHNSHSPDRSIRWQWRFCLLVENVPPHPYGKSSQRMKLFVSGADAEYLLKLDAADLRENLSKLDRLRETLVHLWGNLERRKQEIASKDGSNSQALGPVSSRPFTCCIKEYGVRCSHEKATDAGEMDDGTVCSHETCFGWERRFAMFNTTIHT
ncbi:protection of telomeres protein 1 [Aspergillus udagawae]|uniref:Protection of telomeres protein 1 n=1 Tax=Aspergillus udagawae TaxID=91492 RepID=A0A8H3NZH0_9EURO|nr:protection of telomeres protein 1 [Aspergillus udagawae]GFF42502.1 protection of telomeres protein 1 [Aspergillus udagawae]GFF79832.1 protection of telomeres protein 1 [Aspergillus udagawae]GFG05899.1 protection of telomeres protein 1 [Aspergillus udagawae]GFG25815.1 protection of telomeres protein 1 [Aspergillus udagawae]